MENSIEGCAAKESSGKLGSSHQGRSKGIKKKQEIRSSEKPSPKGQKLSFTVSQIPLFSKLMMRKARLMSLLLYWMLGKAQGLTVRLSHDEGEIILNRDYDYYNLFFSTVSADLPIESPSAVYS